ncbi:MAG: ankyrin repeat domain-containing protein [Proteobacteria bacterium]|nr:ankyrin repeat domain-containing protein [Pseudomonadota bacterium]
MRKILNLFFLIPALIKYPKAFSTTTPPEPVRINDWPDVALYSAAEGPFENVISLIDHFLNEGKNIDALLKTTGHTLLESISDESKIILPECSPVVAADTSCTSLQLEYAQARKKIITHLVAKGADPKGAFELLIERALSDECAVTDSCALNYEIMGILLARHRGLQTSLSPLKAAMVAKDETLINFLQQYAPNFVENFINSIMDDSLIKPYLVPIQWFITWTSVFFIVGYRLEFDLQFFIESVGVVCLGFFAMGPGLRKQFLGEFRDHLDMVDLWFSIFFISLAIMIPPKWLSVLGLRKNELKIEAKTEMKSIKQITTSKSKPEALPKPKKILKQKRSSLLASSKENKQVNENKAPEKNNEQKTLQASVSFPETLLNIARSDSVIRSALNEQFLKGALDLNCFWGEQGDTLLMHLIRDGYIESAKLVIDKIMAQCAHLINEINDQDQTALMVACQTNKISIINYLLENVDNLYTNLRDRRGDNALSIWLKHSLQSSKQTFSCTKKLVERGCELISAARQMWQFLEFTPEQRQELEKLVAVKSDDSVDAAPILAVNLEIKYPAIKLKTQRRKSTDISSSHASEKRKSSQPVVTFEELKISQLSYRQNQRFFRICLSNLQNLFAALRQESTNSLEMFCRHAEMLLQILDLSKNIEDYNKSKGLSIEKTPLEDFMYYIRHSVMPLLLQASILSSAIPAVEEVANQFIQWIPSPLKEKIKKKLLLSADEMETLSTTFQRLIDFFQGSNVLGLSLSQSKLFKIMTDFHHQLNTTEFVPAIHEAYVSSFALPIINEIYTAIASDLKAESHRSRQHVLITMLCSCGDAFVRYRSITQSQVFSDFVGKCRIDLRNRLMHEPQFGFLDVTPQQIEQLCKQAQQAIRSQGLKAKLDWGNSIYGRIHAKQGIAAVLAGCGLFVGSTKDPAELENLVLEYLGPTTHQKRKIKSFTPLGKLRQ